MSEKEGGQYLWIAADGFVVGCFPEEFSRVRPGTTLAIYTTHDAKIYISVYNHLGEKVRDLIEAIRRPAGEFLVVWNGLDNYNNIVPPGDYEFYIILKSMHGFSKRLKTELKAGVKCVAL